MTRGAFLISLICLGVVSLACRPDLEPNTRCLYSEADFGWLAASITPTINDPDRCPDDVPSGGGSEGLGNQLSDKRQHPSR